MPNCFPRRPAGLVFDGAVDPATTEFDVTKTQATGFESALRAFVPTASPKQVPIPG